MADIIPNIFMKDQAEKKIDFPNDNMKLALFNGIYDACGLRDVLSYDQIASHEVAPLYGYPQGGFSVHGKSVTIDDTTNEVVYDMNDVIMTVSGGTFGPTRYGVVYNLSYANHIVYVFDFIEDKTVNDGAQFAIKIDTNGLMKARQLLSCSCDTTTGC